MLAGSKSVEVDFGAVIKEKQVRDELCYWLR